MVNRQQKIDHLTLVPTLLRGNAVGEIFMVDAGMHSHAGAWERVNGERAEALRVLKGLLG